MQVFRIEVRPHLEVRPRQQDEASSSTGRIATIRQMGYDSIESCASARLFYLQGSLNEDEARQIAHQLLADPVTETFDIVQTDDAQSRPAGEHTIEVTLLPGVTDPVAENLVWAANQLGFTSLARAATGQLYHLRGNLSDADLRNLADRLFSNPVIQHAEIDRAAQPPFVPFREADSTVEIIPLSDADDARLLSISAERRLSLDLREMQAIRAYYERENREPTDVELEMLAQTWSEHCVHKTFKASIDYVGPQAGSTDASPVPQHIDGLLRTYIRAATDQIAKPWVRSAFVDNAGIIAFDDKHDLAFKVETHNHPSALEPFGGANTGVGGVIRDVLGVSARPIANTDVLCFGPQDLPDADLPSGVLHPRRIEEGVVHGIEDYGNKMGIPTVNGAIFYQQGYTSNPLVFCGCLGLLPRDSHPVGAQPGDYVVVLGGRTGRDGLRGATFSSMEMDQSTSEIAGSSVQIGHPINEKQCLEVVLQARDEQLYSAITDCGAGGLSSAVGEMASEIGATVHLERVLLKYPGLRPWEIWLSEAQERMVLAIPPQHWARFAEICAGHDIEAVCIGEFASDGRLHLMYGEQTVGEMATKFLHDGIPTRHLKAAWQPSATVTPDYSKAANFTADLLALLAHPNIRSKEAVVRKYDHEVQGGIAAKPLVGAADQGPGDAAVLVPYGTLNGEAPRGAALSAGLCPQYGEIDPYAMAWAAIDEAVRNAVAVGTDPDQIAILDNFCWGNPTLPDRLGTLVRASQGCYDAALAYGTPFISGKDSLNNEYLAPDGQKHAIPGTLLISAVGIVPDVRKTVTMDLKQPGNLLYLIGETRNELGCSHYHLLHSIDGGTVPQPNPNALDIMRTVYSAIQAGLIVSCHDCSEGGLAVALAEMCVAGRLGAHIDLAGANTLLATSNGEHSEADLMSLFAESASRFVVEIRAADRSAFEQMLGQTPFRALGKVREEAQLCVDGLSRDDLISAPVYDLEAAFRGDLPVVSVAAPAVPEFSQNDYNTPAFITKRAPRVLILHARGSNRDLDASVACQLAGGDPEIVTVHQLTHGERSLLDYHMLVVPGGFSFGDDLGAGVLWSMVLKEMLGDDLRSFVDSGRPVLGICNGFQTLVKAGLLPGDEIADNGHRSVTLTYNASGHFECRWVYLKPNPASPSFFTRGLDELIHCPVAHGEGRIAVSDPAILAHLQTNNLIVLTYSDAAGNAAEYPANPNGSMLGIAALTNRQGNVLGLMPHPEDHVFPWQHPRWRRGEAGMMGLRLFENGIRNA